MSSYNNNIITNIYVQAIQDDCTVYDKIIKVEKVSIPIYT